MTADYNSKRVVGLEIARRLCRAISRGLTPAERHKFLHGDCPPTRKMAPVNCLWRIGNSNGMCYRIRARLRAPCQTLWWLSG